jgi:hypothetical protein
MNKCIHITQEIIKTIVYIYIWAQLRTFSVAGCISYNKLPKNIKEIENKNRFIRELKLLIMRCYYSTEGYLNDDFANTGY